jgi:D-cysteine desulfhydrase/L-cysteate sulfo-lyase
MRWRGPFAAGCKCAVDFRALNKGRHIDDFGRFVLGHGPTPLEPLARLSAHLGGPRILVKRDDCTGLALGGNKVRKLEYLIADAHARGATAVITVGGVQSNHARQTAAAAARAGLKCDLVLARLVPGRDAIYERTGNVVLDEIFGARIHLVDDARAVARKVTDLTRELESHGEKVAFFPAGGSTPTGCLGYVRAADELLGQARATNERIDRVVVAASTGGTAAGIYVGLRLAQSRAPLVGVCVSGSAADERRSVMRLVEGIAALMGAPAPGDDLLSVRDEFLGPGYGIPTAAMVEAVTLCARLEGLLLDPVYTGKAMAGLIALARSGEIAKGETVVFWHTGGTPALFAYADALRASR